MIDEQFADLPKKYRSLVPDEKEVYSIEPSSNCPTGTRGRIGVYEILEVTEEIRKSILDGKSEAEIQKLLRQNGMLNLKEDTIIKAMQKLIPFEEIAQIGGVMDMDEEFGEDDVDTEEKNDTDDIKDENNKDDNDKNVLTIDRDLV